MDFDDTPEEAAFREEARRWLRENAKEKDPGQLSTSHSFYDFDDVFVREGQDLAASSVRRRMGRNHVARRVRRSGWRRHPVDDLPSGGGPIRRDQRAVRCRHRDGRSDDHRARHR